MRVWISKYALTYGVQEIDATISERFPDMIKETNNGLSIYHGTEWHLTKEEAIKKAEEMRTKRIESLKNEIAKLEKLRFD